MLPDRAQNGVLDNRQIFLRQLCQQLELLSYTRIVRRLGKRRTKTDNTNRVRAWRAPRSACTPRTYAASYIVEGTGQRHAHSGLHLTPEQVHEEPARRLKVIERTDVSARQLDERQSGQATYKTMSALARPSCASASAADYGAAPWRERDALRSVRSNTAAVTGPAAR